MKTEQLTLEYLEQMTDPTKFKPFQVKLKNYATPKIKLRKSATYTVTGVTKPSKVFKHYLLNIGQNVYSSDHFNLVTEQDHSVTDQFQPEPIHPDNATIETLIQYVSEHRDSMSKDSILHFANLIGLIKLGAL